MSDEEDRRERIENIRARLQSYKCSICRLWLTPKHKRPMTCSLGDDMCNCPRGTQNCRVPDVDDEDVEYLLEVIDEIRPTTTR